jgi:hypothetical protein
MLNMWKYYIFVAKSDKIASRTMSSDTAQTPLQIRNTPQDEPSF